MEEVAKRGEWMAACAGSTRASGRMVSLGLISEFRRMDDCFCRQHTSMNWDDQTGNDLGVWENFLGMRGGEETIRLQGTDKCSHDFSIGISFVERSPSFFCLRIVNYAQGVH